MTPTDKFVEAMSKFGDIYPSRDDPYFDREMIETWTRQAVEAAADMVCEGIAEEGAYTKEHFSDFHNTWCRASLLKRVMEDK